MRGMLGEPECRLECPQRGHRIPRVEFDSTSEGLRMCQKTRIREAAECMERPIDAAPGSQGPPKTPVDRRESQLDPRL